MDLTQEIIRNLLAVLAQRSFSDSSACIERPAEGVSFWQLEADTIGALKTSES